MSETAFKTPQDQSSDVTFILTQDELAGERLTVFVGSRHFVARDDHPNYKQLRSHLVSNGSRADADEILRLLDVSSQVDRGFRSISDRVSVRDNRVFFDGDYVDTAIAQQILRCLDAGIDDWRPLVAFMEKTAMNPSRHSREQLYEWLRDRDFTILANGDFIAYKGVRINEQGEYVSINHGPAIVNGNDVNGAVPNPLGAVVEIARSYVEHDPGNGCSQGLHVGTYSYAHDFANGALLKVSVNPRDVVSVPTNCDAQKMRVCRYRVLEKIDAPETKVIDFGERSEDDWSADDDDSDYYDGRADGYEDGRSGTPRADLSDRSEAYRHGYEDAYEDGEEDERERGREDGYEDGRSGTPRADLSDRSEPYLDGYEEGYEDGEG